MIDLTDEELTVLFKCIHRMCEKERSAIGHHVEAVVIDKIATQLERQLAAPFEDRYPEKLAAARDAIVRGYRQKGWESTAGLRDCLSTKRRGQPTDTDDRATREGTSGLAAALRRLQRGTPARYRMHHGHL